MIKRTIEINQASWLHISHQQLCVEQNKIEVARIPIEDIGVLILAHPAICLTQAVVIGCQQHNAVIVFCDQHYLPYSITLPVYDGHSLHHKILQLQLEASVPNKKRLWQQIVQQKIRQQIESLSAAGRATVQLQRMVKKVKSGDPDNIEAQAAQRYWQLLFGDDFRRDQHAQGINALLNYGYAIIRALLARAVVASGLHPALGLHHANQYNGLCLADDLIEPLRPWVDRQVYALAQQQSELNVDSATKLPFLSLLSASVIWDKKPLPLMVASQHYLADLKRCYANPKYRLRFPTWNPENPG